MTAFTFMAVVDAACYELPIYSSVSGPDLYPSPENIPCGGLGTLFFLPPTLLGSKRRFGIEEAVRGSCNPAGYDEAVFHRMECIVGDGTPHLGYCQYH